MGFRTKNGNREQMLLLPPSLDDWVREDDIVRFYVETVKSLNIPLEKFHLNWRGTGDAMYDPYAMLTLVLYSFSEKRFSTRAMEKACWNDIPSRYIMGNQFPDHTTIARFIQKNTSVLCEANTRVLLYGKQLGLVKLGEVSVDGSFFHANASRKKNRTTAQLRAEVEKLQKWFDECLAQTQANDDMESETPDEARLPESLNTPEKLQKQLELAMRRFEERQRLDALALAQMTPAERAKLEKQRAKKASAQTASNAVKNESNPDPVSEAEKPDVENSSESDEKNDQDPPYGGGVAGGSDTPRKSSFLPAKKRRKKLKSEVEDPCERKLNTTDPESRLKSKGTMIGADQRWNPQIAVDHESRLILGAFVSSENDTRLLLPTLDTIPKELGTPEKVVADRGYFSEENYRELDKRGIDATIPNHMKLPEDGGKVYETLSSPYLIAKARQARSKEGQASLQRRKTTVEPMFGLMKWCLGFRDFLRRGLANVTKEFLILIATINIKRLHTLLAVEG